MKIRTKTTFDPRLQQNGQTACKIVNYKKNPRFQVLPAAIYSCIIQKVDVCKRHHGALAQLGERIAGSDEVRGSIPLGSIPKNPCISRVFLVFTVANLVPQINLVPYWCALVH
jgi:hypothetical protein